MSKLVAVMYTDIVGFTSITETDEGEAIRLNEKHAESVRALVEEHNGVLQDIIGDGSISHFSSASDCLQCALDLQRAFQQQPVVPVRVGIHIGEIRGGEGLIHGNPLNVASRIESIGVAGSILLSRNVVDALPRRPQFSFVSVGKFSFKHVRDPIEVFAVSNKGLVVPDRDLLDGKLKVLERKDAVIFDAWNDRELVDRLTSAKVIRQQAVCSYGFINYNYTALREFIGRGGRLDFVYIHPESNAIRVAPERQAGAAQNVAYIQGQLNLAFHKLQGLAAGTNLKLTRHLPEPVMTFVDPESDAGLLFITLSGFRMDLHDRPSFLMRRSTHKRWFEFYHQSFCNLWDSEDSQTVDFARSWADNIDTLEGN